MFQFYNQKVYSLICLISFLFYFDFHQCLTIKTGHNNRIRSPQSAIGDIYTETQDDGTIICDGFICPKSTTRCAVDKQTVESYIHMYRTRSCLDENGQIIDSIQTFEFNPNPGSEISYHIEQNIDGTNDIQYTGDMSQLYPKKPKITYVG